MAAGNRSALTDAAFPAFAVAGGGPRLQRFEHDMKVCLGPVGVPMMVNPGFFQAVTACSLVDTTALNWSAENCIRRVLDHSSS